MKGTSLQLVWPNQQAQHLIRQGFEPILLCPPKLRKIEHQDRAFHFTLSSSRNDEWVILALHISLLTSRHCSLHSNTAKGCRNNSKHYLNYQVKLTTLNQLNILAHLQSILCSLVQHFTCLLLHSSPWNQSSLIYRHELRRLSCLVHRHFQPMRPSLTSASQPT